MCANSIRRLLLLSFLLASSIAASAELPFRVGSYEITTRTIMPNLAENLRYATTQEQHCLSTADPVLLFPVIHHESLQGCRFANRRQMDTMMVYELICKSSQVARGIAKIEFLPERVSAVLDIQMGGKNMTFSQHSNALWQQDCAP